mgnify:CR=1 FL=1
MIEASRAEPGAAQIMRNIFDPDYIYKNDLVFMDFLTNQKANVFPMVAAGKGLSEMILV